jgi:hypothetical protein
MPPVQRAGGAHFFLFEFMFYKLFKIHTFFKYKIYSPYSFVYIKILVQFYEEDYCI